MADQEHELKALMIAYAALGFAIQPCNAASWPAHNRRAVATFYDGPARVPSRAETQAASDVIFAMVLARIGPGDEALELALSQLRPDQQDRIRALLAEERAYHGRANLTGKSFMEWLATRPLGDPVPEETARAMETAWMAGREQLGVPRPTAADIIHRMDER